MKSIITILFLMSSLNAFAEKVYFINIKDGDVLKSPFLIQFGLSGKGVAPAGVDMENTGHHHLLINVPLPDLTRPIPSDENHIHYGKGQTSDTIELPKGVHRLRLVLGNFAHIPHDDPIISDELIIEVR